MTNIFKNGNPGKFCSRCKEWKMLDLFYKAARSRDGYRSECKECLLKQQQKYYQRNREKIISRVTEYQAEHLHKRREYIRKYQKKNQRRLLDYMRQRRLENLDRMRRKGREYDRSYRSNQDNRIRINIYRQQWRKNNRDKVRVARHQRRARLRSAGKSFTFHEWIALKEYYNYTCLACGKKEPEIKLTPDHVIPLGPPGTGEISNIQPLCLSCNSSKGARTIDYRPLWGGEAG